MRGYSLYTDMDHIAQDNLQWFLDVAIIQEAVTIIDRDPYLFLRAVEHQHLAQALALTGNLPAAEANLLITRDLFLQSPAGARKKNLGLEVEINMAGLSLLRHKPHDAIKRLDQISLQVMQLSDKDIQFEFLRNLGLAYLDNGENESA